MNVDELTLRHQISQLEYKTECQKIENDLLRKEVERLRAELELSKANAESLKKALHEVQNAAIRLGDQVDDAKTELAAAKAASRCPVKWKSVERFFKPFLSGVGNKWGIEYWFDTRAQRDKFGKWIKERGEVGNVL